MDKASKTQKALSVFLSILMVFGYVGLLSGVRELIPQASAATITVNSYNALSSAITTANGASDTTTIQLSGNISTGEVAALPTINKNVILDLHGYNITFSYTGSCDSRDDSTEYQLPSENQGTNSRTDDYLSKALINVGSGGSLQIVNKSGTDSRVMAHTRLQRSSTSAGTATHTGTTSSNLIYSAGTLILGDKTNAGYNNFTLYANSSCYCDGNRVLIDYNSYKTYALAFSVTVNGSNAKFLMYGGTIDASATSRAFYNGVASTRCYALNLVNAYTAEIYGGSVNIVDTSDGTGVQCQTDTDCDGENNYFAAIRVCCPNLYIFDVTSGVNARAGADTSDANLYTANIYIPNVSNAPYIYGADLSNHTTKSDSDSAYAEAYNIWGAYKIANNGSITPSSSYGSNLGAESAEKGDHGMDANHSQHFYSVFYFSDGLTTNGIDPWSKASFREFLSVYNSSSDVYFGSAQSYINDGNNHTASTSLNYSRNGYTQIGWRGVTSRYGAGSTSMLSTSAAGYNAGNGGSLYLYPVWKANVYWIAFNGNGNTGGSAPARILKTYDSPVTLPTGGTLEKTGKTFTGWQTQQNGGTHYAALDVLNQDYSYGAPAEEGAPTVYLYASWGNYGHMITYDLAGGMMPSGVSNPTLYTGSEAVGSIVVNQPVRTGYAFAGWMDERFMTISIVDLRLPFAGADPVDLYFEAFWAENEYVITFDPNVEHGGYVYDEFMNTQAIEYSGSAALTRNSYRAAQSGFTFSSWNTEPDGSGISFSDCEVVSGERLAALPGLVDMSASGGYSYQHGLTLYAQWDYVPYEITYDGNGARVPVDAQTRYDIVTPIVLPVLEKYGYTFEGWEVVQTGSVKWKVGDVYSGTVEAGKVGNVTLCAKFEPIEFTITYTGGGIDDDTTQTYTVEDEITLLDPFWEDYDFLGWEILHGEEYDHNWAEEEYLSGGAVLTDRYGDVTLLAHRVACSIFLHVNADEGATVSGAPTAVNMENTYSFTVSLDAAHNQTAPTAEAVNASASVERVGETDDYTVTVSDITGAGDVTVDIHTTLNKYGVTISGFGYAASNVTDDTAVDHDGSFTLELTLADGYKNLVVTANGVTVTKNAGSGYRYTVNHITEAVAFAVSASLVDYNISINAGTGVIVDPQPPATVVRGGSFSFGVVGDTGYDQNPPTVVINGSTVDSPEMIDGKYTYTVSDVTANTTIRVTATPNTYYIKFFDGDGNQLGDDVPVLLNRTPVYSGADPTKSPTEASSFVWDGGWDPEIQPATENASYTATFTEIPRRYEIKWLDDEGNTIKINYWNLSDTPVYSDDPDDVPQKEATAQYTYTFAGWTPEVVAITTDTSYQAVFEPHIRSYVVTWRSEGGSLLREDTLEFGQTPAYSGTMAKSPDDTYHYTFRGWKSSVTGEVYTDIPTVSGTVTYTAEFTKAVHVWNEGTLLNYTCSDGGNKEYTCTVCGKTKIEQLEAGSAHQWTDWYVVIEPTKDNYGLLRRRCTICDAIQEKLTDKLADDTVPTPVEKKNSIFDWFMRLVNRIKALFNSIFRR